MAIPDPNKTGGPPPGGTGGHQPPPPPAPDPQGPPSRLHQSLDGAQQEAQEGNPVTGNPGGGGTPHGNHNHAPSGGNLEETNHRRRTTSMKAGTAIFFAGLFIALGLLGIGCATLAMHGCNNPLLPSAPGAPTSTGSAPLPRPIAPPSPSYQPSPGPVLTPNDSASLPNCTETTEGKSSAGWYAVSNFQKDSGYSLAARICTSGGFKAADNARVVGRTVYLTDGGHETSGTIDTKYKLSDIAPGKTVMDVLKPGNSTSTVRLQNPFIVFIDDAPAFDYCQQYKKIVTGNTEADDLVYNEIRAHCMLSKQGPQATQHKQAADAIQAWYSRKNGADLEGSVKGLKDELKDVKAKLAALSDKPVDLDFTTEGPTKK